MVDEQLYDGSIATHCRAVQGGDARVISRGDIRTAGNEGLNQRFIGPQAGAVQGSITAIVSRVDIGAVDQEQLSDLVLGIVQRRLATPVSRIGVGAGRDKQRGDIGSSTVGGDVQRSDTVHVGNPDMRAVSNQETRGTGVRRMERGSTLNVLCVCIRTANDEQFHDVPESTRSRLMKWRAARGTPRIDVRSSRD